MIDRKLIGAIALVIGFLGLVTIVILHTITSGRVPFNFGVVIDAGSRHTEITLYKWQADLESGTGVVHQIYSEEADQVMTSYRNVNESFGDYLLPFIEKAKQQIASDRIPFATLYLGATAGMRILNLSSQVESQKIVNSTRDSLQERSGLNTKEVGIISGIDEAVFSWITTNFLLRQLRVQESNLKTTVGMLDMGGASSQIAYEYPANTSDTLIDVVLYGNEHKVRVGSNLCFGADQARMRLALILIHNSTLKDPCLPKTATRTYIGKDLFDNVCLDGKLKKKLDINKNYTFTGLGEPDACFSNVQELLDIADCNRTFSNCFTYEKEPIGEQNKFIAMSAYFYSASILNLTNNKILKQNFLSETKSVCSLPVADLEKRKAVHKNFTDVYCFQLMYIYHTLNSVYKLSGNWSNIEYTKNISDTNLGWSLGYMIHATNDITPTKPSEPVISMYLFVVMLLISVPLMIFGIIFLWKSMKGERGSNKDDVYEPIQQT